MCGLPLSVSMAGKSSFIHVIKVKVTLLYVHRYNAMSEDCLLAEMFKDLYQNSLAWMKYAISNPSLFSFSQGRPLFMYSLRIWVRRRPFYSLSLSVEGTKCDTQDRSLLMRMTAAVITYNFLSTHCF